MVSFQKQIRCVFYSAASSQIFENGNKSDMENRSHIVSRELLNELD